MNLFILSYTLDLSCITKERFVTEGMQCVSISHVCPSFSSQRKGVGQVVHGLGREGQQGQVVHVLYPDFELYEFC